MTAVAVQNNLGHNNLCFSEPEKRVGFGVDSKELGRIYGKICLHFREPASRLREIYKIEAALDEIIDDCTEEAWDGYDAVPISEEVLREVKRFINLLPSSIPAPEIAPEPSGEVALEWYKDTNNVFVASISKNQTIFYAGLFGRSGKTHGTEFFGSSIPPTIIDNIKRLKAWYR